MQLIRALNQLFYFILELCMLGSWAYVGFHSSDQPWVQYGLAVALPLIATLLWGLFAAPRSSYRLDGPYRTVFGLTMFGLAFFALYQSGHPVLAITLGIFAVINECTALVLKH